MRMTGPVLVVAILLAVPCEAPGQQVPPQEKRTSPNLVKNGTFKGTDHWHLYHQAVHDASESRTADGSGSVRLAAFHKDFAITELIPVTPGKKYTYAYYMKVKGWPTLGGMQVKVFDKNKKAIRNINSARTGVSREGVWEENVMAFRVPPDIHYIHLQAYKSESTRPGGVIWVDEAYLGEGVGLNEPPSPKKPFDGAQTRVDELGNIEIRENGAWKPFFPLAVYSANRRDRSVYSKQGWNMDMWAGGMFIKMAVEAKSEFNPNGMVVGIDLSRHNRPGPWSVEEKKAIQKRVLDFHAKGYSDRVVLFYWDNEVAHEQWDRPKRFVQAIREVDVAADGRQNRPVYALQGTYNVARTHAAAGMVDITGTYFGGGTDATGGAGAGSIDALNFIGRLQSQTNPVTFAQFNGVNGAGEMRQRLYHAIILGAKGMGYWRDYIGPDPQYKKLAGDITGKPWWPDFPDLRREVDRMLPLIRTPHWTTWKARGKQGSDLAVGTRDLKNEGYVLLVNTSTKPRTETFRVSGLGYTPREVSDYFTGKKVCGFADGAFTVTIPGIHVGKGTAVLRLAR